jgi:N-acetylmuramoyl-L-alanine amidase
VKAADGSLLGMKVLLDAGHGGAESGALGAAATYGPMEKDLNLAITHHAKEYLENLGATVVMSRTDDRDLSLAARVQLIKETKPDISVSIHNNAVAHTSNQLTAKGYLTCYSLPAQEATARFFTQEMNTGTAARALSGTGLYNSNLALTRVTNCPAVLLENAFLSNPDEYEYLLKEETQRLLGQEIGKAIEKYLCANAK